MKTQQGTKTTRRCKGAKVAHAKPITNAKATTRREGNIRA
jgi:hypothetical protein